MSGLDKTLNPFNRPHNPSVFNENSSDDKILIPQNRELFEFVIREAFSDMMISGDELNSANEKKLYETIRERYIQRVRMNGPSQVTLDMNENKFLEIMMNLCEDGKFTMFRRRIADTITKFAKKVDGKKSNYWE